MTVHVTEHERPRQPAHAQASFRTLRLAAALLAGVGATLAAGGAIAQTTLLNVSYDPTRELYREFNEAFNAHWQAEGHAAVADRSLARRLRQPGAGGDRRPRRAGGDAGAGQRHRRASPTSPARSRPTGSRSCRTTPRPTPRPSSSWCARAIPRASPTGATSSQDGVQVITPNPKTSGGARWNYLAAWAWADKAFGGNQDSIRDYMHAALRATCRCSTPARAARPPPSRSAASATCCSPGRTRRSSRSKELGEDQFDIVLPSISILAEPTVALVEGNITSDEQGEAAKAYLDYLYSPEGQAHRPQELLPRLGRQRRRPGRRRPLPRARAGLDRRLRRLGARCSRSTSATAASSTRSTPRSDGPCGRSACTIPRRCPASGWPSGSPWRCSRSSC